MGLGPRPHKQPLRRLEFQGTPRTRALMEKRSAQQEPEPLSARTAFAWNLCLHLISESKSISISISISIIPISKSGLDGIAGGAAGLSWGVQDDDASQRLFGN